MITPAYAANIPTGTYQVDVVSSNCKGGCNSNRLSFTFTGTQTNPSTSNATVSITGTPTIALNYDSSNKESTLISTFSLAVNGGSQGINIYKTGGGIQLFDSSGKSYNANSLTAATLSTQANLSTGTDNYGQPFITVPANQTATLHAVVTANPKQLFAGTYHSTLISILTNAGTNINNEFNMQVPTNSTNNITIVGETSPYITSISSTSVAPGGTINVYGQRLSSVSSVFVDGSEAFGSYHTNTATTVSITFSSTLASGSHILQLVDTSGQASNKIGFTVTSQVVSTTPLTVSCSASPSSSFAAYNLVWTAQATGGSGKVISNSWSVYNDVSSYNTGSTQSSVFGAIYSTAGTKQAVINVTDSSGATANASCSGTIPTSQAQSTIVISPSSLSLSATVGQSFSTTLQASGITWTVWKTSSGSLPPGLYLSSSGNTGIQILGTPNTAGTYNFTLQAGDFTNPNNYATVSGTIIVAAAQTSTVQPSITVISPNGGETWTNGSTQTISWSSAGSNATQPVEIDLERKTSSDTQFWNIGTIATNQLGSGDYKWTVSDKDTANNSIAGSQYKILIGRNISSGIGPVDESNSPFTITAPTPASISVSPTSLNTTFIQGKQYSQPNVVFTGSGSTQVSWKLIGGSLPTGMVPSNGSVTYEILGTPSTVGTYNFTLQATDWFGKVSGTTVNGTVTVVAPVVTQATPMFAIIGTPTITKTLQASGNGTDIVYTYTATFNVSVAASGADITLGSPGSSWPAFGVSSQYVQVNKNGAPDTSTNYNLVATYSLPTNNGVISNGNTVTIPVSYSFTVTNQPANVYSVNLSSVGWSAATQPNRMSPVTAVSTMTPMVVAPTSQAALTAAIWDAIREYFANGGH